MTSVGRAVFEATLRLIQLNELPMTFLLTFSPNIFHILSETEMHFMQISFLRHFQEY